MSFQLQTHSFTPPWGRSTFTTELGPYTQLFSNRDVAAAIYDTFGADGRLSLEAGTLEDLAGLYVEKVRECSAAGDFSPMLSSNRHFQL